MKEILAQSLLAGSVATLTLAGAQKWHFSDKKMSKVCFLSMFILVSAGTGLANLFVDRAVAPFGDYSFGESPADIQKNIDLYISYMEDLKRVALKGSAEGKELASKKLKEAQQDLAKWIAKRDQLLET